MFFLGGIATKSAPLPYPQGYSATIVICGRKATYFVDLLAKFRFFTIHCSFWTSSCRFPCQQKLDPLLPTGKTRNKPPAMSALFFHGGFRDFEDMTLFRVWFSVSFSLLGVLWQTISKKIGEPQNFNPKKNMASFFGVGNSTRFLLHLFCRNFAQLKGESLLAPGISWHPLWWCAGPLGRSQRGWLLQGNKRPFFVEDLNRKGQNYNDKSNWSKL